MVTWDNLDTLASFQNLSKTGRIDLKKVMSGENGAERVKNYRGIGVQLCCKAGG